MEDEQLLRYSRHIMLPEIDVSGQEKLLAANVLIIGLGGLGSPAAMYLASSGVGRLTLVDFDSVDLTNLQRQILHRTEDVGRPKIQSAKERVEALNPDVKIEVVQDYFNLENARELISQYDAVIDGCDRFPTRFLVNDACYFEKKPLIHLVEGVKLQQGVIDHVALSVSNIGSYENKLKNLGIEYTKNKLSDNINQIFFHDPNGARIELNSV